MKIAGEHSDPEIVEVFVEEAKEEVANIGRNLPLWTADPENSEALIAVRRSFHTLKGSGRTVGAQLIGEFSWSIENLLNRLINQTLAPNPALVAFVQTAGKVLPQLIDQFEIGVAPKVDVQRLMNQAEAFAEVDPDAESLTSPSLPTPALAAAPAKAEPAPEMDPVLADIFVKEMRGHLAVLRDFLASVEKQPTPHSVAEPLYRASHTLLGSARMAGFAPLMTLAAPLAEQLRRHFEAGTGLGEKAVDALRIAANEIERLTDGLAGGKYLSIDAAVPKALEALLAPAESAAPASGAMDDAPHPPAATGYDPDIAGIFAEEAAEILENADAALTSVRQTNDAASIVALQRYLHTLDRKSTRLNSSH